MRFRPVNSSSTLMRSSEILSTRSTSDVENQTHTWLNSMRVDQSSGDHLSSKLTLPVVNSQSPALKKLRAEVEIRYPEKVEIPSKILIRSLYELSVSQEGSHQSELDDAGSGLLSLEEVLIPAIAREEGNALKKVQAKAQRDSPEAVVEVLKLCRSAIYECAESAIVSARAARLKRQAEENQYLERLQLEHEENMERQRLERDAERERRRVHRAKLQQQAKERTKHEMKKKLPKNVELWQEVAFLMTELAKIRKEERMWIETERQLDAEMDEVSKNESMLKTQNVEVVSTLPDIEGEVKVRVENVVEDINLSSVRIQRAVELLAGVIREAHNVRSELFSKYTKDHQFRGYAGVHDPKSLIRILSQD